MGDLATLGMRFETIGADTAHRSLDSVAVSSGRAERATDALNASMQRQQAVMGAVKWASSLLSLAALTAAFAALRRATLEYSASLAEISTLVDTTTVSMSALSAAAVQQAGQFNSSALTQTAALYQIISAGASTAAQATDTLTASNRLAVGGVTTVAIAADGLTSVLNAYGDRVEGATAVSDAMFVAMRAGKTTIGELSSSLGQVAPLAAQVGVSFDELAGATAALTKGGISTSVAVTGLRAILAAVAKPSSEAEKLAKALGLEFNSAALATKGFSGFLEELSAKTGGNTDALALLFGGVEALVPIMALSGQAGQDFALIMDQMAGKAGATGDAFEKVASGPAYQLGVIFSTLSANALQLGMNILNTLSPAISALAGIVTGATRPHWALDVAMKALAITAGVTVVRSLYAMIVPAVLASNTIRAMALSIAVVGPAATAASVATTALGAAIRFALGPVGLAITAVTLLAGAWSLYQGSQARAEQASRSLYDLIEKNKGLIAQQTGATIASAEAKLVEVVATRAQIQAELELARARGQQAMASLSSPGGFGATRQEAADQSNLQEIANARRAVADAEEAILANKWEGVRIEGEIAKLRNGEAMQAEAARLATEASERAAAAAAAQGAETGRTSRTQAERDYDRLVKSAEQFVNALKEETAQIGLNSIQRKQISIDMAAALAPTKELADAIKAQGAAWVEQAIAYERAEAIRSVVQNTSRMNDQLRMMELERDLIGATNVERARQLAMLGAELDLRRQMADIKRQTGVDVDLVNSSEGQAAIGAAGANAAAGEGNRQALASYNLGLEYQLDLLRQIDDHARSAANGMADSFGDAGRALGGLLTTMTGYQAQIEAISEAQRRYTEAVGAGNEDSRRMAMFERDRAQAQVQQYGDMLGAAKGFFKEGSDGYRALQAAEQAYRLFQFAMMVQSMVMGGQETAATVGQNAVKAMSHGVVAVARALASLPFPFNIAAGAATIAALAAIGIRIAGGGGGSKGPSGTGTGFDPAASAERARGQAQTAQSGQQAFAASVAQRVEVKITADRDGMNAYVVGTAEKVAGPIARQESAQMGRQVLDASRRSAPGMQQQQRRLGTT